MIRDLFSRGRGVFMVMWVLAACALLQSAQAMQDTRPAPEPSQPRSSDADRAARRAAMRGSLLKEFDLSNPQIDLAGLMAGGPPKDGIPALTDPKRIAVADADYPVATGRVAVVTINDEAVAYPLGILNYHEIANDTVGGVPVAVTYCPLCDSVSVLDRLLASSNSDESFVAEFGVSGFLYNSNVVMYERSTNGLWSQVLMQAVTGPHAGRSLKHLPVVMMTFDQFRTAHPDGAVLTTETGHERDYSRNPYEQYFNSNRLFVEIEFGDELDAKTLGLGVRVGDYAAFVVADAAVARPIELDTPAGKVIVAATEDAGVTVKQAPDGVRVVQTFWHSWSAFHPETIIVPSKPTLPSPDD